MPPKRKPAPPQLKELQAKKREELLNQKYWRPHGTSVEVTALTSVLPDAGSAAVLSFKDHFISGADDGTISLWDLRKFGESCSARKPDASFSFSPCSVTEVKMLNQFSLGAVAGEHLALFDIRGGNAAAPFKTYKHPVEISCFGESVCTTARETPLVANSKENFVWILDEDGVVFTLTGATSENLAETDGLAPPLRMARRPFGQRKNIGSGLAYCTSARHDARFSSLCTTQCVLTLGMDSELQLYAPKQFYGPVSEDPALLPPTTTGENVEKEWLGTSKSDFDLRCWIDVGLGATPPKVGGHAMQMSNPALGTCMAVSWPYVACGRADGTYVIVDCVPPSMEMEEEEEAGDEGQGEDQESEGSPRKNEEPRFQLDLALASPAHALNGIAALQWYPTSDGAPGSDVLVTVALSGELSAWRVGPLLAPMGEEGSDEDAEDGPACVFAEDVRAQCVDKERAISNALLILPQSATELVVGDAATASTPSKILVGSSDGSIAVFNCSFYSIISTC